MLVLTIRIGFQDTGTAVSARSYRALAFLLDLLLFFQANKFIQPMQPGPNGLL